MRESGRTFKAPNGVLYNINWNGNGYYFIHNDLQHYVNIEYQKEGKHYASIRIRDTGKFVAWIPKPESKKRKASGKSLIKEKDLNPICEMCLCLDNLEVHHVKEVKEGGTDDKDNLRVLCNSCHTLTHTLRSYRNRILKPYQND